MFNTKRVKDLEHKLWTINQRIDDLEKWCSADEKVVMIAKWLKEPDCDISMFREKLRRMENR